MDYKKLASNAAIAFLAQGIGLLAGVITTLLLPKALGVESYGYWQLFLFYSSYVGFFHLGLNDGIYLLLGGQTRSEVNRTAIKAQYCVGLSVQLMMALLIVIASLVLPFSGERQFVLIATAAYLVIYNSSGFLGYLFQALNETRLYSCSCILSRIAFVVPVVIFVALKVDDFSVYVVLQLIAQLISLGYCVWNSRAFLRSKKTPVRTAIALSIRSVRVGVKLMLANVASMLILGVFRFAVDYHWGIDQFAEISLSLSLTNFVLAFIGQVSMVLFPALRSTESSEQAAMYSSLKSILLTFLPVSLVACWPMVWILSAWLPDYGEGLRYLGLLIPICVFDGQMSLLGTTYLKVLRGEKQLLLVNLLAVATSAVCVVIGVFCLDSLEMAIIGVVFAIGLRSVIAEKKVACVLVVKSDSMLVAELALVVAFVLSAVFLSEMQSFVLISVLYSIYVAFYGRQARLVLGKGLKLVRRRKT